MNILAKITHGSRLYRTNGEGSDFDFKTIFQPSLTDCLLLRAKNTVQIVSGEKNGEDKSAVHEGEAWSLQAFLHNAAGGDDFAITSLHCSEGDVITDSKIFQFLRKNRTQFYTKSMAGMMQFSKSQCTKYALRADRMEAVEKAITALHLINQLGAKKLRDGWDKLPEGLHMTKIIKDDDRNNLDKRHWEVAGKLLPATIAPEYALDILQNLLNSYGERVRNARNMDNKDLKSVSHAFRTAFQLRAIFTEGDFGYPLRDTEFIKAVKYGQLNYVNDGLDVKLNELICEVEELAKNSTYPEKVDTNWLDSIVLHAYAPLMNEEIVSEAVHIY